MPNHGAVPKSFRALMQRLGVAKIKNSPARRVEKAAVKQAVASSPSSSSSHPSPSAPQDATGDDTSNEHNSKNDKRRSVNSQLKTRPTEKTNRHKSEEWNASTAAELLLARLQSPAAITDQLRAKGQEAIRLATEKATKLLEAARENPSYSSASAYFAKTSAEAESAYHKLQATLKASKRDSYSRMPFDERWDDIQSSLAVLGRVSTDNTVVPYRDSAEAFQAMWRALDSGKEEVLWQTYICKDDHVGQTTVQKLAAAKMQRGCKTELLYDCGGNISGRSRLTEQLKQCGATVIPYRPFFRSTYEYVFKGFDWRISPGLRNHRKILLVDKHIGFCGGLNIGNEYCGPAAGGTGKFRDTHCSVVGPAAAHLREVYDDTKEPRPWKYSWRRWRQIATTQLNRQYETGRHAMEGNFMKKLQDTTNEVKKRGGIYFSQQLRKAEANTSKVLDRMRWQKQARQRLACERRTVKKAEEAGRKSAVKHEEAPPAATASLQDNTTSSKMMDQNEEAPTGSTGDSGNGNGGTTVDEGDSAATDAEHGSCMKVMRRKVLEARIRALYNATDLPHKRSYTSFLLQLPIMDNEPVPEAEMYMLRRPATTQIVSCNPRYRDYSIQYAFWQVTRKCHRRIWVTTPYYLPTKKLFRALLHAAARGVDVRILAGSNQTTDPWFMWHASNYITGRLLHSGVKIYEFKGSQIMHAKTVVADSVWCSIGSYNWDVMSNKNLEVCLCQLDLATAREMEKQFLQDMAMSEEVRLEDHMQRSLWLRFTSWLFYNIVYLLDRITFRSFANEDLEDSAGTHED